MDLWQLHVYCKVIELKSFSKAAAMVHLSQPTVSSHIKDLESYFGTRLIDRMAREALPTKAGELLYGYARKLILLRSETEAAMAEFHGKIKGTLKLGGSTIPGGYLLPKVISAFSKKHPEVKISLHIGDTKQIIEQTLAGQLEVSVVGAKTTDRNTEQKVLLEDELCLIVPSNHKWAKKKKIEISKVFKEPFILREKGSGTLKSFQLSLLKKGFDIEDLNTVAELGSNEAIRQAVKLNTGISILSALGVSDDVQHGLLKTLSISGLDMKRYFYLTTNRKRSTSPVSKAFIRFIQKEFT